MQQSVTEPSEKTPTVVKANSLIQAGYRLTLAEQRVLLAAIALIGKDDQPTDQTRYSVTADALSDLTETSARRVYQELAEAAHRLYRREVRIEEGPNGEEEGPRGTIITMTRWVQSVRYIRHEGRIELRFSTDILPYLSMLKKEFTSYKLRHVATMRSTHGVRLYELLAQWRQAGEREIRIEDLKRMFGVEGKYDRLPDLKRYVIEPAVRDVNQCSDLTVEWGQRKAGRRVTAIQFTFKPKKQPETDKSPKRDGKITEEAIERAARPGESRDEVIRRLENERRDRQEADSNEPTNQPSAGREHKEAPEPVAEHIRAMREIVSRRGKPSAEE